eukprot:17178_1
MDTSSSCDNLDSLDNHHCPKCNWSFMERIPRTLDCKHSFYFCENCLKRKEKVKCGICRRITIIKQILSPRSRTTSLSLSSASCDIDTVSQFATLPTRLLSKTHAQHKKNVNSFHQLFTSPLKQYKHYSKHNTSHAGSEPIKHSNIKHKLQFEYDQIINIEKEIITLKNEMETEPNTKHSETIENEVNFMKKQIVDLLIDKEKAIKRCNEMSEQITKLTADNLKLTQQNIKQNDLRNKYEDMKRDFVTKLEPIRHEWHSLSNDIKTYKERANHHLFKPFALLMENQMNELRDRCKQSLCEYNKEVSLRRRYFNDIQELKGNIRVYCRIRPLLSHEMKNQYTSKVEAMDDFKVKLEVKTKEKTKYKTFEFDRVFSKRSTQNEVFDDTKELITSVLDGYNVCIFAYGQTGSGKTYTMEGINYRAMNELFSKINERKSNYKYQMKLNMVEIYNDKVKDLLATSNGNENEKDLKIRAQPTYLKIRGDHVANLSELKCESINDVFKALDIGYANRSFGVTDMNAHSSRSHCILTIHVEGNHFKSGNKYTAKLNLIDLAGSERVKMSNATGNTLKETQAINKSLSCLGNVLESIRSKKSYIPYRDSKLTFLLKDSIGNGAKTLMFVNISPCSKDIHYTLISLLFANRVSNVCLGKSIRNQSKMSGKNIKGRKRPSSITST